MLIVAPIVLIVPIVIGTSIWAAADAAQRDWSALAGPFGLPMGWAWVLIACLALWIIAFPCYLAERGRVPIRQMPRV